MGWIFNPFTSKLDWAGSGGGTGTPAGSNGAVQFNSSGSFGADTTNFNWDDTINSLQLGTSSTSMARLISTGTVLTPPTGATASISGYDAFYCAGDATACDQFVQQENCEGQDGCTWNDYDCGNFSSEATCNSHSGCSANVGDCSDYNGDQEACEGTGGCTWETASCSGLDETDCGNTSGCTQNYYDCSQHNGDEGGCNDHSGDGCSWDDPNCTGGNFTECTGNYNTGNCTGNYFISCDGGIQSYCNGTATACSSYSTQTPCNSQDGCSWSNPDTYQATGKTHRYKVYAYKEIGGVRFYSSTASESNLVTDNNGGLGYNVSLSWTAPTAYTPTGYRVLKNYNSGGYTNYIDTTTPYVDGGGLTAGTTVTPNTYLSGDFKDGGQYIGTRALIENSATSTSKTDLTEGQVILNNTNASGISTVFFANQGVAKTYIQSNASGTMFIPWVTSRIGYGVLLGGTVDELPIANVATTQVADDLGIGGNIIQSAASTANFNISGTTTSQYLNILTDANGAKLRGYGSSTNVLKLGGGANDAVYLDGSGFVGIGRLPYLIRNNVKAQLMVIGANNTIAIGDDAFPQKPDDSADQGINLNALASTSAFGVGIAYDNAYKLEMGLNTARLDNHSDQTKKGASFVLDISGGSAAIASIVTESTGGGSYTIPWAIANDNTQGIGFGALSGYAGTLAVKSVSNSTKGFYVRGFDSGTTAQIAQFDGVVTGLTGGQHFIIDKLGNVRMNSTVADARARLDLSAGTTSFAPLIFTTGTNLTSPLAGAMEFTTDDLYFTITTGTARKNITLWDTLGTSGRIPFATTNGRLTDDADLTFSGDTLSYTKGVTTVNTYTAGSGGTTDGMSWNDSTQKAHAVYEAGVKQMLVGTLFTQTATGTVANTTSETAISSTGVGSLTLPANFFVAGKTIRVQARGFHSSVSTPTIQIKVKFGSTVILDTGAINTGNGTNDGFLMEGVITCRSTGGSGTVLGQGSYSELHTLGVKADMVNTTTTTIDTTASQTVSVTVTWGTAASGNTISLTNFTVEVLN